MITGINHITIAVSQLNRSFDFYVDVLGLQAHARWKQGAYLSAGGLWICLSKDDSKPAGDYSHIAFTVASEHFEKTCDNLRLAGVQQWKQNSSEGDSLYFLDPDRHKLEIHCGNLTDRLKSLQQKPYDELELIALPVP